MRRAQENKKKGKHSKAKHIFKTKRGEETTTRPEAASDAASVDDEGRTACMWAARCRGGKKAHKQRESGFCKNRFVQKVFVIFMIFGEQGLGMGSKCAPGD